MVKYLLVLCVLISLIRNQLLTLSEDDLDIGASFQSNDTLILSSIVSTSTALPQVSSSTVELVASSDQETVKTPKQIQMMQFVRREIKKEIRKLKSSITDSVMEEVISYYGKKIEMNDAVKQEIDNLNKKLNSLTQNLNTLGQNYKSISKNHRNLVDIVRNNLMNLKKEKEMEKSRQIASQKSNRSSVNSSSRLSSNIQEIIKKKAAAADQNKNNDITKLKMELINDLETKYLDIIDDKITDVILKNLNTNNSSITSSPLMITDARKLVIRQHEGQNKDEADDDVDPEENDLRLQVLSKNRMPTGKKLKN
jgi:hypothetical protein